MRLVGESIALFLIIGVGSVVRVELIEETEGTVIKSNSDNAHVVGIHDAVYKS